MDAFFASVEERERPYLKGKPIIVGADPEGGRGRGVVSTASYAARVYGIRSATPITKAWRLCEEAKKKGYPACVFVTGGFDKYERASREVFEIIEAHVPRIEKVSVDEGYLDVSFCRSFREAELFAKKLKSEIKKKTRLSSSIGIGPNKLIAKIASDYRKPNGLTVVTEKNTERFIEQMPLITIPGIGPEAAKKFSALGIKTVRDAKKLTWEQLEKMFGSWGFGLYERLRGIDRRVVQTYKEDPKSIGKHHTFSVDTRDIEEVLSIIRAQTKTIFARMKKKGFKGFRTTVLTIRFSDFSTISRSSTNKEMICTKKQLEMKATKLLLPFFEKKENPRNAKVRLVGLRIEKLK